MRDASGAGAATHGPAGGPPPPTLRRGWRVVLAGLGINLALGVLYSWSVVSKHIPADWQWTEADKSLPYSMACLVFSLMMVPAGRMQDRIGPRAVATVGGLLVGVGVIIASRSQSVLGYVLGFGLLAGAGIGCGYASTTPPAVKWFPAARTGAIAGMVVAGFGLANVYVAPLAEYMIRTASLPTMMLIFGLGFLVVVTGLAQFLAPPPKGFVPEGGASVLGATVAARPEFAPATVLRTPQFYLLWFIFACNAGAGLMIISKLARIVEVQAGLKLGFLLVASLGLGNGAGRIIAGSVSDRIGRRATLVACSVAQAGLILLLSLARQESWLGGAGSLAGLSALIGANYGANLALFPSLTKDYYGLKNFGVNYGLVFTAWGLGGFTLSLFAGWVYDGKVVPEWKGSFAFAYYCSAALLVLSAAVALMTRPPSTSALEPLGLAPRSGPRSR